jgi:hypothetical protein
MQRRLAVVDAFFNVDGDQHIPVKAFRIARGQRRSVAIDRPRRRRQKIFAPNLRKRPLKRLPARAGYFSGETAPRPIEITDRFDDG